MSTIAHPALGITCDANDVWTNYTAFAADVQRWRELGIKHVMILSGSISRVAGMLDVLEPTGLLAAVGGQEEIQPFLGGSGPDTQAQADSVVAPVATVLAGYGCVEAVLIDDEPFPSRISRLRKVVDAYRRLLPGVPVLCNLIGLGNRAGQIQQAVGFDRIGTAVYPCAAGVTGNLDMGGFGYSGMAPATYVRQYQQEMGVNADGVLPLWVIAQVHDGAAFGLRRPTLDEVRQQYDEARKLGAERVYWFNWHSRAGEWTGLKDLPAYQTAIAELDGFLGVPMLQPDYVQTVEAWWGAHPFNVESPNYRPTIKHPGPWLDVDDHGDNLWQAIQALPQSGGTVWLSTATYNAAEVYAGQFSGFAKNNVHIMPKPGASPKLDGLLRLIPCHEARDYVTWSQMVAWNQVTNTGKTAREVVRDYQIRGWYLGAGIVYDGLGGTQNVSLSTARDIVIDGPSEFRNIVHPGGTVHPAHITGNSRLDNIWIRGARFRGRFPATTGNVPWLAVYLDGLHGGGVITSESDAGAFVKGTLLYLTNDDFSRDFDLSGALEDRERRTGDYTVSIDNVDGANEKHLGVTGKRWLVLRAKRLGVAPSYAFVHADSKSQNVDNSPIPPQQYQFTDGVLRDCYAENMGALPLLRQTAQNPSAGKVAPVIGRHTVVGNTVNDAGYGNWVVTDGPNAAGHVGPNTVGSNGTAGGPALPIPWLPTAYPYLPPLDPLALAEARIAELEQELAANEAVIATLTGSVNTLTAANSSLSASLTAAQNTVAALTADLETAQDQRDALATWKATARTLWASLRTQMEGP